MKYKLIKSISIYLCCVIILLNVLSCVKIEKNNLADNNSNTVSTSETNESDNKVITKQESENIVATSNDASKAKNKSVYTPKMSAKELMNIKPSTEFLSYFKLDAVPVVKKYSYDNLELLYSLEQYFNNRVNNKIGKYFENNSDSIFKKLDKTVFLGNTNVDNFYSKYDLLKKNNVYGMPEKTIVEEFNEIDKYDFKDVETVIICNGFTNKDLIDKDEYLSVSEKLCDSIKGKNPSIKIYVCSLLPVGSPTTEPYQIEKFSEYNLKSVEINNLLSNKYKDSYIDINFLTDVGDYEYDGSITKEFSMKIISYLANYLAVKNQIIDAPMPTLKEIEYKEPEKKYIYMTFDDGPSENGKLLLSILDKYNVKVTMFYTGNSATWRQNIIDFSNDNQKIAAHTFTHDFKLYSSEEQYFEDLYKIESLLKTLTGNFTRIVRFPGGSANATSKKYCIGIMKKLIEDFKYMGYTYYDWNASSGDGSKNITSAQILENAKDGVKKFENPVVLFHETHDYTVAVIEDFIKWAIDEGYEFRTLDYDTLKCHQSYSKLN